MYFGTCTLDAVCFYGCCCLWSVLYCFSLSRNLWLTASSRSLARVATSFSQPWAGIPDPGNSREYRPPIPIPKVGNGIFHSHSRSRKREWNFMEFSFPFLFPKIGLELVIPVPVTGNGTSKSGKVPFLETSCISGKVKANIWFNIKELLWIHSIELSLFRQISAQTNSARQIQIKSSKHIRFKLTHVFQIFADWSCESKYKSLASNWYKSQLS